MQVKDSSSSKQTSYRFTFYLGNQNSNLIPVHPSHTCLIPPQRHLVQTSKKNAQLLASLPVSPSQIPSKSLQYCSLGLEGLQSQKVEPRQSTDDDGENQGNILHCSLIDELLRIDGLEKREDRPALADLDIMECESLRSSQTLQEEYSDIVSLTEEEKEFFSNFAVTNEEEPFDNVKTPTQRVGEVLAQRKRVIRNFFRPKGSFIKEDRTCCNSQQNLEDMNDIMGQGSPLSLARQRTIRERGVWTEARLISFNN